MAAESGAETVVMQRACIFDDKAGKPYRDIKLIGHWNNGRVIVMFYWQNADDSNSASNNCL